MGIAEYKLTSNQRPLDQNSDVARCILFKEVMEMHSTLQEIDKADLINVERLAHIIRGLSAVELETLEILLDKDASDTITQSLEELKVGERVPIDSW